MKPTKETKATTIQKMQQRIVDLDSQSLTAIRAAIENIGNAGDKLFASGAVLKISALGGRSIVDSVCISDGLSPATIDAIRDDLIRTWEQKVSILPKGMKK